MLGPAPLVTCTTVPVATWARKICVTPELPVPARSPADSKATHWPEPLMAGFALVPLASCVSWVSSAPS